MVTRRDANELIRDESGALIQDKWQDFVETHKPGLRVRQLTHDERDRERDRHIGDERRRHARDTQERLTLASFPGRSRRNTSRPDPSSFATNDARASASLRKLAQSAGPRRLDTNKTRHSGGKTPNFR